MLQQAVAIACLLGTRGGGVYPALKTIHPIEDLQNQLVCGTLTKLIFAPCISTIRDSYVEGPLHLNVYIDDQMLLINYLRTVMYF